MSYIKSLILILFILMLMTALAISQTPIKLNGSEGLSLLNSLTQSAPNQTNNSLNQNNDSLNAYDQTANIDGSNWTTSSPGFWSWGTKPKSYPGYYDTDNSQDGYLDDPTMNT